jgi:hypothetical protein
LASAHAFTHETDYSPTFGGLEISAKGKKIESYPSLIFGQNNILSDFTLKLNSELPESFPLRIKTLTLKRKIL